jgi:hypothetical protein
LDSPPILSQPWIKNAKDLLDQVEKGAPWMAKNIRYGQRLLALAKEHNVEREK